VLVTKFKTLLGQIDPALRHARYLAFACEPVFGIYAAAPSLPSTM
jgi:hypothetical protein